ncbi:hypothetical protein CaCOL14_006060 [Colletotrichum acutatum]
MGGQPSWIHTQYCRDLYARSLQAGGDLEDAGGVFPDVAIWDDNGNRLGRYRTKLGDKIAQSSERTVKIPNNENKGQISDPQYVMLSHDTDATCIAMVQVSNGRLSGTV